MRLLAVLAYRIRHEILDTPWSRLLSAQAEHPADYLRICTRYSQGSPINKQCSGHIKCNTRKILYTAEDTSIACLQYMHIKCAGNSLHFDFAGNDGQFAGNVGPFIAKVNIRQCHGAGINNSGRCGNLMCLVLERESTPFQPHRADAGAARTSPGRYHNRVFNHCVEQQN